VPVGHITNGIHMPSWDSSMPTNYDPGLEKWWLAQNKHRMKILTYQRREIWNFRRLNRTGLIVTFVSGSHSIWRQQGKSASH
jgi:S-adenosylmethionine:diacylglycerol 3-amino-3-carboxypropyl transferase